ncbi:heterokaryon incompatibility protein-domain-containing protein [Apiosordaria backusii]|uniref:Heterokaryon incompatibility protein-domain-containing protein n=1 Tax=Apiosordaria backusii TaxID=314023 RepID=A0AA40ASP1_9PEZI|nr:heterokaryon incompatibility protein-domain-containing protein [Apiosordaria backusii]
MKLFRKLKQKADGKGKGLSETASLRQALPSAAGESAQQAVVQRESVNQPSASTTPAAPIQVLPSSDVCQVCFHLDPTQAPRDGNPEAGDPSWAVLEYNVPPETRAAKIVPKSEDLISSAGRGCMHCFIVRAALNAVYAGWENEKTILHIFLAPGLPIVVLLEFGTLVTTQMSQEEALRSYGLNVPVTFTATITDPEKPAVEVEIYRPLPATGPTVGNDGTGAGFDLSSLVGHLGFGEDIPQHAGDETSLNFIKQHVEQCISGHNCGGDKSLPLLPDRVIWVQASTPSRIQLVEPKGVCAKYIALSYCWGPVSTDTYLTDARNLASRKAGINYDDLPPLLRDVVTCARALGIQYLWVDRLCIVQGDGGDFSTQAPKMGDIYGNATLTIAAACGTSENDVILLERDTKAGPFTLDLKLTGMGTLTLKIRKRTHRLGTENNGGDYGRVSTRAWIWQERLLSSRTVFFTPQALKFECHHHSVWQGYGPGVVGHSWSTQVDLTSSSNNAWLRLVGEFMKRNITYPADRLPAIESVMRHIARNTSWTPCWGVFQEKFIESLGWVAQSRKSEPGKYPCRMNPGHYAPTWSWASVEGDVTYLKVMTDGYYTPLNQLDPLTYDLQYHDLDRATGAVTMIGRYVIGGIQCIIEKTEEGANTDDDSVDKYHYSHKIRVSGQHPDFLFEPDVPLMPSDGDPNEPYSSSVVRVPYGRECPTEEWTGHCLVLLLARRNKRSLAILLGASLRNPNGAVWERLGLSSSIDVSVWDEEHVKTGPIRVV